MAVAQAQLQQFVPFAKLNDEQFQAIEACLHLETLAKGSFIIKRGKPLKAITFLLSGRVDLVDASFSSESVEGGSERSKQALTEQSPSDVSAQAKTEVEVLHVDHQAFDILDSWSEVPADLGLGAPLEASVQEGSDDWMTSLLDSPLFAQVPPTQLQQLFARFEPVQVAAGEIVVEESAEGDFFYVIESGQAKVQTRFDGEVATLGPGQFFGEEALVGDTIRNATVAMTSPGILMRLNKDDFRHLLQEPLIRYVDAKDLQKRALEGLSYKILDVRLPLEYRIAHVRDASNLPLASLRKRLPSLEHDVLYVVTDDGGKRSEVAAHLMCQAGFDTYILENSVEHYAK